MVTLTYPPIYLCDSSDSSDSSDSCDSSDSIDSIDSGDSNDNKQIVTLFFYDKNQKLKCWPKVQN